MKIHTLKNRWLLPALCCAALAMTSQSKAAIIVTFEQRGNDVHATWTGALDLGTPRISVTMNEPFAAVSGSVMLYKHDAGETWRWPGSGSEVTTLSGNITQVNSVSTAVGFDTVGFYNFGGRFIDYGTGGAAVMIFANQTLFDIGADAFSNTLAWTSDEGGTNTISYTTIPEPSSSALVAIAAGLALLLRRRR